MEDELTKYEDEGIALFSFDISKDHPTALSRTKDNSTALLKIKYRLITDRKSEALVAELRLKVICIGESKCYWTSGFDNPL